MDTRHRRRPGARGRVLKVVAFGAFVSIASGAGCGPPPGTSGPSTAPAASPTPATEPSSGVESPELTFVLPTKWPFATAPGLSPEVPPIKSP